MQVRKYQNDRAVCILQICQFLVISRVWGQEVDGCYCGDEAASWFQQYFGKPDYKLVYFRQDFCPKYAKKRTKYEKLLKETDKVMQNLFPPFHPM